MPASASPHVSDGGHAADITNGDQRAWVKANPQFGWCYDATGDTVHMNYYPELDETTGGSPALPSNLNVLIQNFLNIYRGEALAVDGVVGPATSDAIKRYQEFLRTSYGYAGAIDGIWGDATQASHMVYYNEITAPPAPPPSSGRPSISAGSTGQDVTDLQNTLNANYPLYSDLGVDGQFGPATDAVVREFQTRAGLTVDGIVGPATWAALGL
jgi:peptidoglycan hydrolase-like protein with peptidoglycan-binding domain